MPLTINDLLTSLEALKRTHGGTLPVWLVTTVEERGRLGWRPVPSLVPAVSLHVSLSAHTSPAVFVHGLGTQVLGASGDAGPANSTHCPACGERRGYPHVPGCPGIALEAGGRPAASLTLDLDPGVLAWGVQLPATLPLDGELCPDCGEEGCDDSCRGAVILSPPGHVCCDQVGVYHGSHPGLFCLCKCHD